MRWKLRISNVEPDLYQMPTGCPRKGCQGMTFKFFTRSGTITRFWLSFHCVVAIPSEARVMIGGDGSVTHRPSPLIGTLALV